MTADVQAAIILTTLAGLATGLGSLASYFIPRPDMRYLSISLGFAAGVMIFVAFVDLFYSSRIAIGLNTANMFFLLGLLAIYTLDHLVPHIHLDGSVDSHGE